MLVIYSDNSNDVLSFRFPAFFILHSLVTDEMLSQGLCMSCEFTWIYQAICFTLGIVDICEYLWNICENVNPRQTIVQCL